MYLTVILIMAGSFSFFQSHKTEEFYYTASISLSYKKPYVGFSFCTFILHCVSEKNGRFIHKILKLPYSRLLGDLTLMTMFIDKQYFGATYYKTLYRDKTSVLCFL